MAVVAIVVIVVSIGAVYYGSTIRRNQLLNQLKYVRAAFLKAKANAIEHTAPIRFSLDPLDSSILILRDHDRDGDFSDSPAVVMGLSTTVGMTSPYKRHVRPDSRAAGVELPIWFQSGVFANRIAETFPNNEFIVMPTGRVHDPTDMSSTSGTFFFYSRDRIPGTEPSDPSELDSTDSSYFGAVHITAMGEVKLAFLKKGETSGGFNGWKWLD
jgi:hypothetical protein